MSWKNIDLVLHYTFTTLCFHPQQAWEAQEMPTALRVCSPNMWLPWAMMQPFLPRAGYDTNTFHTIWHIRGVFTYDVYLKHVYEKPKDTCLFAMCGNPLVTSQIQYSSHPEVRLYEVSDVKQTLSSSVLSVKSSKLETSTCSQDSRACQVSL